MGLWQERSGTKPNAATGVGGRAMSRPWGPWSKPLRCSRRRAGPGGKRAAACLSEASSADPAWTEHRRESAACQGGRQTVGLIRGPRADLLPGLSTTADP